MYIMLLDLFWTHTWAKTEFNFTFSSKTNMFKQVNVFSMLKKPTLDTFIKCVNVKIGKFSNAWWMNDFIFTIRIHVRCTIHREQKNCNRYQNLKLIISTALYRMLYLFTSIYVDFLSYFYCIHLIYNNKNKVVVYLIKLQRRANGNLEFCMISFFTDFFSVLEVHDYAERRGGFTHVII